MNAAETIIAQNPTRSAVLHRAASIVGRAAYSTLELGNEASTMGSAVGFAFDNDFAGYSDSLLAMQVRDALATLGFVW